MVYYPSHYMGLPIKTQTYRVEADNAELRHYLARLARASRCFSRLLDALWNAVKLHGYAENRRQFAKRHHSQYPYSVAQFLYP